MKRRFTVEVEIDEDPEMVFTKSNIREAIEEYVDQLDDYRYQEYELEVKEITAETHLVRTMSRNGPDEPHQHSSNTDIPERYQI